MLNKLIKLLKNKQTIFVFIGTEHSQFDGIAPRIGTRLKETLKNKIYGVLGDNIDKRNFKEKLKEIKENHKDAQIIAVDLGYHSSKEPVVILNDGISPGSYGSAENADKIGDISIIINMNVFSNGLTGMDLLKRVAYETPPREFYEIEENLYINLNIIFTNRYCNTKNKMI